MEKLTRYVPSFAFVIYLAKCLSAGPTAVDAAILGIFATLLGYAQYKNEEKAITELKNEISLLKNEQQESKKHQEELRSHVSSMKIGMNMRSNPLNGKNS